MTAHWLRVHLQHTLYSEHILFHAPMAFSHVSTLQRTPSSSLPSSGYTHFKVRRNITSSKKPSTVKQGWVRSLL